MHVITIDSRRRPLFDEIVSLWRQRELLWLLTWRNIQVRYKQAVLGGLWAVLQPALLMLVFTVFLGPLFQFRSADTPYPLFTYCGLVLWIFFSTSIASAAASIVESERLITKVYFPRLAIPLSAVLAALFDFVISCSLLIVLMLAYQQAPGLGILVAPLLVFFVLLAAIGVGAILASLNVRYRDFRYVVPFMIQAWMFATPTIYLDLATLQTAPDNSPTTSAAAPEADGAASPPSGGALGQWVALFNPLVNLVAAFRASLLGLPLEWSGIIISGAICVVLFLGGTAWFVAFEDTFADVI